MKHERTVFVGGIKRLFTLTFVIVLMLSMQATVFASDTNPVLVVNTALNVESQDDDDDDSPQSELITPTETPWAWHPISVANEPMNGFNAIRKTFALPPDVNPVVISTNDIEMFGQRFTFAYVTQQPTSNEAAMEIRETITKEARSRNLNDILPNLEQEIWYDRDGFAGTLVLDIHSIAVEVAGTTRNTTTATRQRTYPNLSSADNALIPRTITDGGTTFHLSTVDWQTTSVSSVDGHPVTASYTAHATYTAQVTQTRTTGYTVTAEYVGTVFRTTQGTTLFTAVFYGEPIIEIWLEEPEPENPVIIPIEPEPEPEPMPAQPIEAQGGAGNAVIVALAVLGTLIGLAAFGAGGFFLAKHLLGYNVTIYSIDGPRDIVKAGRIKIDLTSPEPTIVLDKTVGHNTAKTDRYIIQFVQRAIPNLIGKHVRVVLRDKEAVHEVPETARDAPMYEFEVNFSDDDDDPGAAPDTPV